MLLICLQLSVVYDYPTVSVSGKAHVPYVLELALADFSQLSSTLWSERSHFFNLYVFVMEMNQIGYVWTARLVAQHFDLLFACHQHPTKTQQTEILMEI